MAIYMWREVTIPINWLLAYYPFEADWNDASWNNQHATVTWCSFWTVGSKKWVRLETSWTTSPSNYIISPLSYNARPVTAICWVYPTLFNDWINPMWNTTQPTWSHADSSNNIRIRFANQYLVITSYWNTVDPQNRDIPLNDRTMLWITIEWTSLKVYKNWTLIDGSLTSWTNNSSTWPRALGRAEAYSSNWHCWTGWLRHSAIYNRALSDEEMATYYVATQDNLNNN